MGLGFESSLAMRSGLRHWTYLIDFVDQVAVILFSLSDQETVQSAIVLESFD